MNDNSTIVALSTHPGRSAIALVRLSGADSERIVTQLFDRAPILLERPPGTAVHGQIVTTTSEKLDEVIVTRFRHPHSYTGEDMVEISCHGSTYIVEQLLAACCASGARPAEPGEFTRRAFLNDKIDLTRAESVEALINSTTAFSHRNALMQLNGRLYDQLRQMRQQLIELYALLEAELDFAEEEITVTSAEELKNRLDQIIASIDLLLASYRLGRLAGGAQVVITGAPNVGKSTLMNQMLREDRVIVSPESGTTRDAVSADIDIEGIRVTLWDTAGLRDTTNLIELEGIDRAQRVLERADVVIQLHDCTVDNQRESAFSQPPTGTPLIQVWNKQDLAPGFSAPAGHLTISATGGNGITQLLEMIYEALTGGEGLPADTLLLTNLRHFQLLQEARKHLLEVKQDLAAGVEHSLLVIALRDAAEAIGTVDGSFDIEEVLDVIFSRFCIGK